MHKLLGIAGSLGQTLYDLLEDTELSDIEENADNAAYIIGVMLKLCDDLYNRFDIDQK